jgi:hypothetical protein
MRALFRIVRRVGLLALGGLVLATPAAGQTGLATVTGLVADSSGAAVPGVTVTATNQATNIAYTGTTNDAGNYAITSVPIGEYLISAGLTGFKGVQSRVTLSVAQTARVDFKMEVGNIQERVEVIATGAVLQTENAVVGIKADREQVEKLPAISRNVSFVTMYAPGVTQPLMANFTASAAADARTSTASYSKRTTSRSTASTPTKRSTTPSPTSRVPTRWNRSASKRTTIRPSSVTSPAQSSTW